MKKINDKILPQRGGLGRGEKFQHSTESSRNAAPYPPIPPLGRKIPNLTTTRLGPSLQVLPLFPRQQPLTTTTESTGSCLQAEVLLPLQQTTTTTTERTGSCLQAKHQASKQASKPRASHHGGAGWVVFTGLALVPRQRTCNHDAAVWAVFTTLALFSRQQPPTTTTGRSGPC